MGGWGVGGGPEDVTLRCNGVGVVRLSGRHIEEGECTWGWGGGVGNGTTNVGRVVLCWVQHWVIRGWGMVIWGWAFSWIGASLRSRG
eukprot:760581-Hanusia_phi.AAC.2